MNKDVKVKHIVHVVHCFATGGLENGVVNIINKLPKEEYKHSIICVTNYDPVFFERITTGNVKIYSLEKPSGKGIKWLWQCWKLLKQLKPDICHTRNLSALEAQIAASFAGVPYRIHGEHGWDVSDVGGTNYKYQQIRRIFKPFIHRYVALSSEAQCYLGEKINVNPNKVMRICNGVDIEKFKPKPKSALYELSEGKIAPEDIVFGTVGRLAEIKNQTFLVKSFIELVKDNPILKSKLKLIIVGDGILLPRIQNLIQEAKIERNVWLAGRRDDIAKLMNLIDIFVLPSLAEGISNTLLEAMASGSPFIATNVGGNVDLVCPEHSKSHLVDVNDIEALKCVMQNYADGSFDLNKDSQLVRTYCVRNFSIEAMVSKYHQLYQLEKV